MIYSRGKPDGRVFGPGLYQGDTLIESPSWVRLAQDPADEHDWVQYFADPTQFRDCRFEPDMGWVVPGPMKPWFIEKGLPVVGGGTTGSGGQREKLHKNGYRNQFVEYLEGGEGGYSLED